MAGSNLFALPPGVDFPQAFVAGLLARRAGDAPDALARTQIFLPSARMLRRVRAAFDGCGAGFLPRLRLVTELGAEPVPGLPAAVPPLRRKLELAQLVARMTERQPDFAAGTGTYALAESLSDLLAEMQMEGVAADALERLDVADHAAHWQHSLRFLRIVTRYFDPGTPPDSEARLRRVVEARVARWASAPPPHPVIVAGSTGSRGATALLMQAVARLPNGVVVLPGFDFEMPQSGWDSLDSGPVPAEDHPQYRFAALSRALGVTPIAVRHWHPVAPASGARNALLSLALRPAPVTDSWMRDGAKLGDLREATRNLVLIEAADPRAEATALALVLREAAETGVSAALISPDRLLTRRVAAALERWRISVDDSAGQPLPLSPPGRFLRHVAALAGRKLTLEALFVLLKHPLTATGADARGNHLRFTRDLELHLRRHGPAFPDAAALSAWAEALGEPERAAWAAWLATSFEAVQDAGEAPLSACIDTHIARAETLAAGPGGVAAASALWQHEAGREAVLRVREARREAAHGGSFTPAQYASFFERLIQPGSVRLAEPTHPHIAILGSLEARVHGAELVICGGLNEGSWPQQAAVDPWLSRRMRLDAGLLLPERQIGLAAHDFQQAVAAPRVVLSRAARSADAETVASRWLNRLTNLLAGLPEQHGVEALEAMRARGRVWLNRAAALDTPRASVPAAPRPAPRPPAEARPRELPVTAIKTLIRDPYAVYAQRILRLRPLDPLRPEADPRARGEVLHLLVEAFVRERPEAETLEAARARLTATAARVLAGEVAWPAAQRFWLARIERIGTSFARSEVARAAEGTPVVIEKTGSVRLKVPDFTLTAKPDRIDLLHDGRVRIFDYKSGKPPTDKEMATFDKQLLLEAAMAERGGFAALGPRQVAGYSYIQLGGSGETREMDCNEALVAETWEGLHKLLAAYLSEATSFVARRAMQKTDDVGDYDHLSRFGEWDTTDAPVPEDVR
ncbi:double-strand break repair protein AddB [Phaeovulum sp.]|uniref:double-strand break repair protein AddB n=1 Tax=Phaeovulum sp. TaxID=2934796 RepID=UPI00272FA416|nr:double-strand break repair protein AddB [Phaeovulum sp.]MDP1669151.1 double-strand break repair protein AddB [Phaeovulum sp.]MDZ4117790.1 double-strand break repair protein AddB [Phaeovulum sp.]